MAAAALGFFAFQIPQAAGPQGAWLQARIAEAGVPANRRVAFAVRRASFAPGVAAPPVGQSLPRGAGTWDYVGPGPIALLFLWRPAFEGGNGAVDTFSIKAAIRVEQGVVPAELGRIWAWVGQVVGAPNVAEIPYRNVALKAGPKALAAPWNCRYVVSTTPVSPSITADLEKVLPFDFVLCSRHLWHDSGLTGVQRTGIVDRWKKEALVRRLTALFTEGGAAIQWNSVRKLLALYLYVAAIDVNTPYPDVWRTLGDPVYDYRGGGGAGMQVVAVRHAR